MSYIHIDFFLQVYSFSWAISLGKMLGQNFIPCLSHMQFFNKISSQIVNFFVQIGWRLDNGLCLLDFIEKLFPSKSFQCPTFTLIFFCKCALLGHLFCLSVFTAAISGVQKFEGRVSFYHSGGRFGQTYGEVIFTVCRDMILLCGATVGRNDKAIIHCFEAIFGSRLTQVKNTMVRKGVAIRLSSAGRTSFQ